MNKFKTTQVNGKKVVSLNSILDTVEYIWQEAGAKDFSLDKVSNREKLASLATSPILIEGERWLLLLDAIKFVNAGLIFPTGLLMEELRQTFKVFDRPEIKPMGEFAGLSFNPPGDEEVHKFDNGARKISSLYLTAVSQELFKQGQLDGKKPRLHKDVLAKIRGVMEGLELGGKNRQALDNTYFAIEEGTYFADKFQPSATHIWMSPDLCLLVAASEHLAIRARIIDDLNRLQRLLEEQNNAFLVSPSLPAYLQGTLENQYREQGLVDLAEARTFGYYPMAQVKYFAKQQLGLSSDEFDVKYPFKETAKILHRLGVDIGKPSLFTRSQVVDKRANLYSLEVLKEYFDDIDFSTLEE